MTATDVPSVRMIGITKTFPGVVAIRNIDFETYRGEIHGLLGENGAGKSTLMKILSGYYKPDRGEIWIRGHRAKIRSPADAIKHGIGMVYQHFSLVNKFTVLENIMLSIPKASVRKESQLAEETKRLAKSLGFDIDPDVSVSDLSVGQRQRVEVLKILMRGSDIIILDEPTSILAPVEISGLFEMLRRLAKDGRTVIFITHKLEEATSLCDRITVLRNGVKVGTLSRDEIRSAQQLVSMIFGTEVVQTAHEYHHQAGSELLRAKAVTIENDLGVEVVRNLDLKLYKGEVLGIAGVEGNGQYELGEALAGVRPIRNGEIYFEGKKLHGISPRMMYDLGVRYITADKTEEGLILDFNITENLALRLYRDTNFANSFLIPWRKFQETARETIKEFNIVARGAASPARTLSGGNLQKLLVAREMLQNPKLIIANQPTHGLDVKTTQYIHSRFLEQVSRGSSILLISNDLSEVLTLSDRVAVMFGGRIVGVFERGRADRDMIGRLMVGQTAS